MPVKARIAAGPTFAVVTSRISALPHRDPLGAKSLMATMATAERLRAQARTGTGGQPLRGKNLALLLGPPPSGDIATLRRAAQDLGARVAEVRFTEPAKTGERDDVLALARMLGRMYDAVDCEALAPSTARRIEQEAGVPVYDGLCLDEHPARALADLMTLREHRSPPGALILFLGDPKAPRGSQFVSAARAAGFEVLVGSSGQSVSNDAQLLVDARHPAQWKLLAAARPLDEGRRVENHRCVMQAVLLDTIVKA
jgi:ornithine carbamoyltransferase